MALNIQDIFFIKNERKVKCCVFAVINPSDAQYNSSIPLQAQHQTRVMPLWWKSRGAPAHLPQSHYPLTLGNGVQTKALPTARPRVSTLMILQRSFLTKGKYLLQIPLKERFVTFGFVESCKSLKKKKTVHLQHTTECFSLKSTSQISK